MCNKSHMPRNLERSECIGNRIRKENKNAFIARGTILKQAVKMKAESTMFSYRQKLIRSSKNLEHVNLSNNNFEYNLGAVGKSENVRGISIHSVPQSTRFKGRGKIFNSKGM